MSTNMRKGPGNSAITDALGKLEVGESTVVDLKDFASEMSARGSIAQAGRCQGKKFSANKQGVNLRVTRKM